MEGVDCDVEALTDLDMPVLSDELLVIRQGSAIVGVTPQKSVNPPA